MISGFTFTKLLNDFNPFTNHPYVHFAESFRNSNTQQNPCNRNEPITTQPITPVTNTHENYLECILCNERIWNEKHNCTMC